MSGTNEETAGERERKKLDREPLVSVREVQDEATATMLCDFLKSQGIEAAAEPVQIWGRVEVLGKDAARARTLIEEYLAATPEQGPGEEKI